MFYYHVISGSYLEFKLIVENSIYPLVITNHDKAVDQSSILALTLKVYPSYLVSKMIYACLLYVNIVFMKHSLNSRNAYA